MTSPHNDPLYAAITAALSALPIEQGAAAAAKRLAASVAESAPPVRRP